MKSLDGKGLSYITLIKFYSFNILFVGDDGKEDLKKFLQFMTGLERLSPLGLEMKIHLKYKSDQSKTLNAETCALNLVLPTVHNSQEEFEEYFLLACIQAHVGFGLV